MLALGSAIHITCMSNCEKLREPSMGAVEDLERLQLVNPIGVKSYNWHRTSLSISQSSKPVFLGMSALHGHNVPDELCMHSRRGQRNGSPVSSSSRRYTYTAIPHARRQLTSQVHRRSEGACRCLMTLLPVVSGESRKHCTNRATRREFIGEHEPQQ